jgi:hypothetical protein
MRQSIAQVRRNFRHSGQFLRHYKLFDGRGPPRRPRGDLSRNNSDIMLGSAIDESGRSKSECAGTRFGETDCVARGLRELLDAGRDVDGVTVNVNSSAPFRVSLFSH